MYKNVLLLFKCAIKIITLFCKFILKPLIHENKLLLIYNCII